MKKIFSFVAILIMLCGLFVLSNCPVPGEKGKNGKNGITTTITVPLTAVTVDVFSGEIQKGWNEVDLTIEVSNISGIRFFNMSDSDIILYYSFDEKPICFDGNVIRLNAHEGTQFWRDCTLNTKLYFKSCSVGKEIRITKIMF